MKSVVQDQEKLKQAFADELACAQRGSIKDVQDVMVKMVRAEEKCEEHFTAFELWDTAWAQRVVRLEKKIKKLKRKLKRQRC
jgi:hypothetical protein